MFAWIASHWDTILTVGSLLLNALGGTGVVKPVVNVRQRRDGES